MQICILQVFVLIVHCSINKNVLSYVEGVSCMFFEGMDNCLISVLFTVTASAANIKKCEYVALLLPFEHIFRFETCPR